MGDLIFNKKSMRVRVSKSQQKNLKTVIEENFAKNAQIVKLESKVGQMELESN